VAARAQLQGFFSALAPRLAAADHGTTIAARDCIAHHIVIREVVMVISSRRQVLRALALALFALAVVAISGPTLYA
jgi:hypothetical protein